MSTLGTFSQLFLAFITISIVNKVASSSSQFVNNLQEVYSSTITSILIEVSESKSEDIYFFNETEGSSLNKTVFNFNKKGEKFKLKEENRWITVDESGTVRVKQIWDFEKLDNSKSFNFTLISTLNGTHEERTITFTLLDVNDEYPYFVNTPLPFNAIVAVNAPPGTTVFKLLAKDDDVDSEIHFFITKDESTGLFEVDERTGDVKTKNNGTFSSGKEYVIYVSAEDRKGHFSDGKYQRTNEERLSIVGGRRPPQFFKTVYNISLLANTSIDTEVIHVKAISFTSREIKYTLTAVNETESIFKIDQLTGAVTLIKNLTDEDAKKYSFIVKAFELPDGFSSSAELKVIIECPKKPEVKPANYFASIDEDIPVGTAILQLPIAENGGDLFYSVDRNEFKIDNKGVIFSTTRLDADSISNYQMNIKAIKKGSENSETNAAVVNVYMANKNDEPPKFDRDVFVVGVDENVRPNTIVANINANDKDGDNVFYYFDDQKLQTGVFTIENRTGEIRTVNKPFTFDQSRYELVVYAQDDGSCCRKGTQSLHTSSATVLVSIVDVNDNKPVFEDCDKYSASVAEESPKGTPVITVKATDKDKGLNGEVRYSIASNQRLKKFTIDEKSGLVKTNKVFDREGEDRKFEMVTVKAWDKGSPSLEGICTFKVDIVDKNDNSPLFDKLEYHVKVKQDSAVGSHILKVLATDEDSDMNGDITYSLSVANESSDMDYFRINPSTGWISVKQLLNKNQFRLKATASDNGAPVNKATVEITVNVFNHGNNPPVWSQSLYGPITVRENIEIGRLIVTLKAYSGIPDNPVIFYEIIQGNADKWTNRDMFFINQRLENGITYADLHLNQPLDCERTQIYNLLIRATNNGETQLFTDVNVHIVVEDVNDEIPQFDPAENIKIRENMSPGTKVIKLTATDLDATSPNNKVFFAIESLTETDNYFSIDRETGDLYSKVEFDREQRSFYALLVKAFDGSPSAIRQTMLAQKPNYATKFIRIEIEDENDNTPYFEKSHFEAEVFENEDLQHTVIMLTAKDKDESSRLEYSIVKGNIGDAFGIKEFTGEIFVTGNIDYEKQNEYQLKVAVSDGLKFNFTTVIIYVKDVNDNPPTFERSVYEAWMTEEDDKNLPKKILQVKATDGDKDRNTQITYFLSGSPVNHHFSIDAKSGEVFVMKPLDRDLPNGRPEWRFTVFADDERGYGLLGYAEVIVYLKDVNDNAPFFPHVMHVGTVRENATAGMFAVRVNAIDFDDPNEESHTKLKYTIERNAMNSKGRPIFKIDESTGVITTAVCCLDREKTPEHRITVGAVDGGGRKGTGTAVIKIIDVNDMSPKFVKRQWDITIKETVTDLLPESPIAQFSVNDDDLFETNRLTYKIFNTSASDAEKFNITSNRDGTASLFVLMPLDYEDPQQKYGFNLTISVSDEQEPFADPSHVDTAKVRIRITDVNDNAPRFDQKLIELTLSEDMPKNETLVQFHATDEDRDGKSQVEYFIDQSTDKRRQFKIDENGVVTLRRKLDRDVQILHEVHILAVDDGIPPMTGTGTLKVIVSEDFLQ